MLVVTPMVVQVNEAINIKIKLLGTVRKIASEGNWNTKKPNLNGQYNLNHSRGIQYLDNVLPEWSGILEIDGGISLDGPKNVEFDRINQGVFLKDKRPIRTFKGWKWLEPGFHWIKITDPVSGISAFSNPVLVLEEKPENRIFWGDPHWQTFFTDGIHCPEELYSFARDEAFLDFGAISDHSEGLTEQQWKYFNEVTNDYNEQGKFATLVGFEWTSIKWGHRNVYYRGNEGQILRSDDPKQDTLTKIWSLLENKEAIAIPHHTSNVVMGVDWGHGWNPKYEKAVEIHSVWGNSECHADDGNPQPIKTSGGEKRGQHVIDALKLGYRFGFVGGGDIHDGRPGDDLHKYQEKPEEYRILSSQGFTASFTEYLSRENIYDSIKAHSTYATTRCRIYLDVNLGDVSMGQELGLANYKNKINNEKIQLKLSCAAPEEIESAIFVHNGKNEFKITPSNNPMLIQDNRLIDNLNPGDFCYIRIITKKGNMAWSSPIWIDE